MVGSIKEELEAMKQGLTDIIPPELLSGLTAEVCGVLNTDRSYALALRIVVLIS